MTIDSHSFISFYRRFFTGYKQPGPAVLKCLGLLAPCNGILVSMLHVLVLDKLFFKIITNQQLFLK